MNTYSHVIPALRDESAERMDALFDPETRKYENAKTRELENTNP